VTACQYFDIADVIRPMRVVIEFNALKLWLNVGVPKSKGNVTFKQHCLIPNRQQKLTSNLLSAKLL
jgi:hypothetical protein